ncbi:hypothetical protein [Salinicoccus roseus]|uniref:Uncharacterized protein n=1 Tax=Salinicoccus roseus TaxID=45670 RepID=A0A0C2E9H1_9STAP|nr:hypothetical protein [Salinicoccus roseus]KIH71897.1 hypothetical protein SN16_00585 [Salinicoccus roseus]MDB0579034.1 hypothetical protein [Salinicoccus roseus]
MKRLLYIPLTALLLGACGNPTIEQELEQAKERNEELKGILQTEEVNFQKNTQRLDALKEDISKMKSVIGNPDIDNYVDIVTDYAGGMERSLTDMDGLLSNHDDGEELSGMESDFEEISSELFETMEAYDENSAGIELDEYLERQHNAIQLANGEIRAALDTIANGIEASDSALYEQGIEQLRSAHEYY